MKELLSILLFFAVVGAINALRWLIERQQRQKEQAESAPHPAERQAPVARPGRPVFYGRTDERISVTPSEAEAEFPSPTRSIGPRLRPLGSAAAPADADARPAAVRVQHRTRRPAAAATTPQPSKATPSAQAQTLGAKTPRMPGLEKHPPAAAEPHPPMRFLGDVLAPKNLARAVVLGEILGPPMAFRDP
jgi:cytoskeletal protein RodZ